MNSARLMAQNNLDQVINSLFSDKDKQLFDAYMTGKGDEATISKMAVSGITVGQLSQLNNALYGYFKEQFPDNAKNFDSLKAEIDDYLSKLGPGGDPGLLQYLLFPHIWLIEVVRHVVHAPPPPPHPWWQFWHWFD